MIRCPTTDATLTNRTPNHHIDVQTSLMDIQRYLLIAAAAALSFMLLTEWTAFKDQRLADERDLRSGVVSASGSLADNTELPAATDAPAVPISVPDTGDDLPAVELPEASSPGDVDAGSSADNAIRITTEVLDVVIDLTGGDIIETSLTKFPEKIDDPDTPLLLLEQNTNRTYIMQSGLVGPDGIDTPSRARYSAEQRHFRVAGSAPTTVTLVALDTPEGVRVEKQFTLTGDSYTIEIGYRVSNSSMDEWQAVPFAQLKRDSSAPINADSSGFGMQPFLGAATTTPEDRFLKFSFSDIAEDPWKIQQTGGWIAMLQHYFTAALIPAPDQSHSYSTRQTKTGFNIAGFTSTPLRVGPQNEGQWSTRFYVGPKDQYTLAALAPHLELVVDYGWLWWIAQPLFWLLTQIQAIVSNWGVAIILLTLLIKTAFYKLSAASYRSMARMRKVQPKMMAIREQHASDKQKQSQAMMELYKKEKINPMGGCLPILVQMPVFIALYWVLMESVELRQAPFALWIKDLSVMDPYFVLPVMMGASMFFMQKLNPPPPDPMQAKLMQWLPVVFTFFFLWFPAGLVLYWVVNNLLSMAQQYVITRKIEREGA